MRFHTNLPVHDIEATTEFYRTLFQCEPTKKTSDYVKFLPPGLGLNISFSKVDGGAVEKLGSLHLGVELPDQQTLDRAHELLAAEGLITQARETAICCYANQDKFWVTDPNGYQWELYLLLEDTAQRMQADTACCETSPRDGAPEQGEATSTCC